MHIQRILRLVTLMISCNCAAQDYQNLNHLQGHRAETYFSKGKEEKAKRMASQVDHVMRFYDSTLHFTPSVTLLILSPDDWSTFTSFPFYGMPHYSNNKTLVVASDDNAYWQSMLPKDDLLSVETRQLLTSTYRNAEGKITMEPFFDLLSIHELGHAYNIQGGLKMQRRWLGELFPNIMLHTYIALNEPSLLPALTLFPRLVVETTPDSVLTYTSLQDLETHYNEMGPKYPVNYGWYQCRWHMAAAGIYDKGGLKAVRNLWDALKKEQTLLSDSSLVALLGSEGHPSIADVQLNWDKAQKNK